MERLTKKAWRNLDPWECCGQDEYCQRGCYDSGGCTGGCIVPRLYTRLGAYEDTGLTPGEIKSMQEEHFSGLEMAKLHSALMELKKYQEADKEGRVAVLPCKVGGSMLNMIDIERPEIMKGLHFAVAYESVSGIIFYQPYNIFCENVDAGHIKPLSKEAEAMLKEAGNG